MRPAPELLASALVLGFAGSVHCLAMCGGIAGALAQSASARGSRGSVGAAWLHSAGRVVTYAGAGAVVGGLGAFAGAANGSTLWIRLALGVAIVLIGAQVAAGGRVLAPIERAGYAVWRRLAPRARIAGRPGNPARHFALGLLWGALPCGLVYSALIPAAAAGSAAGGALAMTAFGLGTLPALLSASSLAALVARLGGGAAARRWAGSLLVAFGVWSLAGTWAFAGGAGHAAGHANGHAAGHADPAACVGHAASAPPAVADAAPEPFSASPSNRVVSPVRPAP